ncbi:MAG: hypothetical protein HF312_15745 [Ignavibacteria bacterium]|jgi:hypothetical protein|nr:hypothetical protein [Ignavibacteria bacterium]
MSLLTTLRKPIKFLLRDDFDTDLPAGAVNGTKCRTGQTRTVTDTENKMSVAGGKLVISGGKATPVWGDPGVFYPTINRQSGRIMVANIQQNNKVIIGFALSTTGAATAADLAFFPGNIITGHAGGAQLPSIGSWIADTAYNVAVLLRSNGMMLLLKSSSDWRLMWVDSRSNVSTIYPAITNNNAQAEIDTLRIPHRLWLPTPLLSDGFSLQGISDGKGHAEGIAGGLGSGGGGVEWQGPTWSVSGGYLRNNPSVPADYYRTATLSTPDVVAGVQIHSLAAGAQAGLTLNLDNQPNPQNLATAYLQDGRCYLAKTVSGVKTTVMDQAATFVADAWLYVIKDGTGYSVYYNDSLLGTTQTIADPAIVGNRKHCLYSTGGVDIKAVKIYARGTEGQYNLLEEFMKG